MKRANVARKAKENGLWLSVKVRRREGLTYLRLKWGSKVVAGRSRNAGKVMRLKMPTTTMKPRMDEARMPERFCTLR